MANKPHVFLVSRDPDTVGVLEGLASKGAVSLICAENAYRAAGQAKTEEPDVVILDDTDDETPWHETYQAVREGLSYTFVPVLVLSDADKAEQAVETLEAGLVDVLVKPVSAAELRSRLHSMVQIKRIHDEFDVERSQLKQKLDEERRLREQLAILNEELKKLSTTDGLTGLSNQRYLNDWLKTEFEVVSRYGMSIAAIMMDLDNFKQVNDVHGHLFGDFVLKDVAEIIRQQSRKADVAARYGGEEFAVILPNTDGYSASNLAHRIHRAVGEHIFEDGGHTAQITVSLGISTYPSEGVESAKDLLDMADRALYAAKEAGRDRVVSWAELAD